MPVQNLNGTIRIDMEPSGEMTLTLGEARNLHHALGRTLDEIDRAFPGPGMYITDDDTMFYAADDEHVWSLRTRLYGSWNYWLRDHPSLAPLLTGTSGEPNRQHIAADYSPGT